MSDIEVMNGTYHLYSKIGGRIISVKTVVKPHEVRVEVFEDNDQTTRFRGVTMGVELLVKNEVLDRSELRRRAIAMFMEANNLEFRAYALSGRPETL